MQLTGLCITCLILSEFKFALSFRGIPTTRYEHKLYSSIDNRYLEHPRREFLQKAPSLFGLVDASSEVFAIDDVDLSIADIKQYTPAPITTGNFDCLLDLPPITPGCVRLYLCRHGQTENNRVQKVGSLNDDTSINQNGFEQAQRMGLAVYRLDKYASDRAVVPTIAVHSQLRRARETAEIAVATANKHGSNIKLIDEPILSLAKMDYGSLDGKEVNYFICELRKTFASWSLGNIDKRAGGGGESGREILERSIQAIEKLSKMAKFSSTASILAVSHSTYLRILLSLVGGVPLAETFSWRIQNGSINIVDVNVKGKRQLLTSTSGIFGGEFIGVLRGSNGLQLDMPVTHLIRKNEVRHLEGMNV